MWLVAFSSSRPSPNTIPAWDEAYSSTLTDLPDQRAAQISLGFNRSDIHQDAMIGGPEVDVFGLDQNGVEVPVITADRWVLR
jgi:leucyl aminopeptidase (aminopeptidase T)